MLGRVLFLTGLVVFWATVAKGQITGAASAPAGGAQGSAWRATEAPPRQNSPQIVPRAIQQLSGESPIVEPSGSTSGGSPRAAEAASPAAAPIATAPPSSAVAPPGPAGASPVSSPTIGPPSSAVMPTTRASVGGNTLPTDRGQVWREYDISAYTMRVTATERPEQAIIDWILRETGYEAWHGETAAVLSATKRVLRVYHTPQMQTVVAEIVDRFIASEADTFAFSLRLITLDQPNWRTRAQRFLKPVNVQTPGVSAWLMSREEAAGLLAELQRRTDFREHSSPHLLVTNGQSTVVSAKRPRSYVRDLVPRPDVWPGFESQMGQVEEGFALEFNPLLSLDRRVIDAAVKCEIDQLEKLNTVSMDVIGSGGTRQRTKVEVPQLSQYRFHERFRWPADQVLVIGFGMAPMPIPVDVKPNLAGIPLPLTAGAAPRGDLLMFIEARGPVAQTATRPPAASVVPALAPPSVSTGTAPFGPTVPPQTAISSSAIPAGTAR